MGTRSLTFIHEGNEKEAFVCMYRQFDGYPSGHGEELAKFLKPIEMVNGYGGDTENQANGAGCLAAQMVVHFKKGIGGFYLMAPSERDAWQEYEYHVFADDMIGIRVEVYETGANEPIYAGNDMAAFEVWCVTPQEETI